MMSRLVAKILLVSLLASLVVGHKEENQREGQDKHQVRRRERFLYDIEDEAIATVKHDSIEEDIFEDEWDRALGDMSMDCHPGKGSKKGTGFSADQILSSSYNE